jgi:hypothetical protein
MAVFWGVHDNVIPIAHARRLANHIEGIVFQEFEKSGHYPHYDEADAFVRALTHFLDVRDVPAARWAAIPAPTGPAPTTLHATPTVRLKPPTSH